VTHSDLNFLIINDVSVVPSISYTILDIMKLTISHKASYNYSKKVTYPGYINNTKVKHTLVF